MCYQSEVNIRIASNMPELLEGYKGCLENWTLAFAEYVRGGAKTILLILFYFFTI